ncbi:hypothetical protein A9Q02_11090 [Candidatus Chloroploca asiatica]|uniref:Uncharacterized protein n=1 Tax=Candidatus Chloroploca asiatica TaxID=1506545 RepID=A0A2H3L9F9_9CHLR|nr:hypothetical protein A9Q02_11090 [Candidatus Chloroploca asiatica]
MIFASLMSENLAQTIFLLMPMRICLAMNLPLMVNVSLLTLVFMSILVVIGETISDQHGLTTQ